MKFLSLFSGIGGFDLGLERAGMQCVGQVEIDPYCRAVLAKHWPNVKRWNDASKFCRRIADCEPEDEEGFVGCPRCLTDFGECECVGTDEYIDENGVPDLIVGGDPCQGNSNAKTHGTTAATLGGEFVRIVEQLRPRLVLRENPSAVRRDAPWPWERFANALTDLGYSARPFRARACCAGADHRRERMFVLAALQDADSAGLERHERQVVAGSNGRGYYADPARPDRWSATPRVCGSTARVPYRVDRLRGLGNAVVPAVAEVIGRAIMEAA